jgi:serine/threonine-protein kinase HipA
VGEALQTLLAAGSATLGGARPKASVRDGHDGANTGGDGRVRDGDETRLLIAKFPWTQDEWDVMAWEKTALDLAERCGVTVPARRLVDVGGRHVLLVERFDRRPADGRVGYLSARTLAERPSSAGNDYLDLVAAIEDHSGAAAADLRALWRRIAVTAALHNSDDHFHNHGFLRVGTAWRLAPAFDINIDPRPAQPRATSLVGAADRDGTLQALVREAAYFGVTPAQARSSLREIRDALEGWREVAAANRVPASELDSVGWVIDDFCRTVDSEGA